MRASHSASETIDNLRHDLQALRGDVSKLTDEIPSMLSDVREESLRAARERVKRMKREIDVSLSQLRETREAAAQAVGEATDEVVQSLESSLKAHPVAVIALAVGLGCLIGAGLRR